MQIHYDVSPDDVEAFARHVLESNAYYRRSYYVGFVVGPMMGALVLLLTGHESVLSSIVKVSVTAAVFSGLYAYLYRREVKSSVRRTYGSGSDEGPLGSRSLQIDAEGLTEVSQDVTTRALWPSIKRVEETGTALYVFNGPASAFIVPKRAFANETERQEFLGDLRRYRAAVPARE